MPLLLSLCLIASASLLLAAGLILQKSALPSLAETVYVFGARLLLLGFALLFALAVCYALKYAVADIAHYFSRKQSVQRKLLFAQTKLRDMRQLRLCEQRQLDYFNVLARTRLLRANNDKHLRLLARSIGRQLRAARDNMPRSLYKELRKDLRRYRRRSDGDALLALQKRVAAF